MHCGEFIGELFRARDITHIEHLQSSNWGGHMALNELYTALEDHIDTVAELRLARGKVDIKVPNVPENVDILNYLESELLPKVDEAKEMMNSKGYNDISAEIDIIKTNIMKTIYKLNNLTKEGKNHGKKHGQHDEDLLDGGILYKKKCKGGKLKCGGGKINK